MGPCGQFAEPVLVERSGQHRVRRQGPPLPVGNPLGLGRGLLELMLLGADLGGQLILLSDQLVVGSAVAGHEQQVQPHQGDNSQGRIRQDFFATL